MAALCYAAEESGTSVTRVLVVPVEFSNLGFTYSRDTLVQFLNSDDFNVEGACGSVRKYFSDQFGPETEFIFDLAPVVTLPRERSHYGANAADGTDVNPGAMVTDACTALKDSLDFTLYDNDSDGKLDHLIFIYAGRDESDGGEPECLWSHSYRLSENRGSFKVDGITIDLYCCASELGPPLEDKPRLAGIGRFCHELLHTFGLPDFYDTGFSDTQAYYSAGLWGTTSIMDKGFLNNSGHTPPNLNAIEREILSLGSPVETTAGRTVLRPVREGVWLRLESGNPGEYFLAEYRDATLWDEYIGGHGLLVYHIDKSENECGEIAGRPISALSRWEHNLVNGYPSHQCADLMEACAANDRIWRYSKLDSATIPFLFFPEGSSELGPRTEPALRRWDGKSALLSLTDIRETPASEVSFQIRHHAPEEDSGDVPHINTGSFPAAEGGFLKIGSRVPLKVDNVGDSEVRWYADDVPTSPDSDGRILLDRSFTLKAVVRTPDGGTMVIIKEIRVK